MFKNMTLSVQEIEGIGPKTEAALSSNNVHTLLDFIAQPLPDLVEKLQDLASEKETKKWLLMACFMQIDAINGQFAEALVKGGAKSISEIAFKGVEELEGIFAEAENRRIIPKKPERLTIFEMIREATILTFSHTYLGKLSDEQGSAISNAAVKVYYQTTTTNTNGYFRLFGLMSSEDKLLISTEEGRNYQFEGYPISRYPDNIELNTLVANSESEVEQKLLSEYDGDMLPSTGSYPILTKTEKTSELRRGDIFLVRSIKPNKNEVTLQSIYNEFDGSKFTVRLFRFSSEEIAANIKERDYVKEFLGELRKLKGNRSMVKVWKQLRRTLLDPNIDTSEKITITN